MNTLRLLLAALAAVGLLGCAGPDPPVDRAPLEFSVMAWNILHGGRDDGDDVGPARVIDVIRDSGADVIAMQETYGSGERISDALGYHFHPRGTNVSIHSRFPIVEDVSVGHEFKCVGAILALPDAARVAVYSIWLPYDAEIWEAGTRDGRTPAELMAACASSRDDLEEMLAAIRGRLAGPDYAGVPIIIAGDFNSMSHLDYTEAARDQYGVAIDWPTSHVLIDAGFRDTYRDLHPVVNRRRDRTWTPRFPEQEQDRIDFVYLDAAALTAVDSVIIDDHAVKFPSDHAAVVTTFRALR